MNGPHYLTVQEAMDLLGIQKRTLYERIESGLYQVKFEDEKAANGKRPMKIVLSSLGPADQARWWMQRARAAGEGANHADDPAVEPGTAQEPDETSPLNLAEVSDGARDEALRRLPIVQAAIEILETQSRAASRIKALATRHGLGPATLYRWIKAFREGGYPALIPGWGKKKGTFTALSTELQLVIAEEYLQPSRPSPTTIYRRVLDVCAHLGQPAPSSNTINRFLMHIPRSVQTMARHGHKTWRDKMEPKTFRDLNALAPNEFWCGDHRKMDVFVRISHAPDAKIFRPWLTAWMDLGTRTCVGWQVALVPNSDTIAMALRKGMLRFGAPQSLYVDNGKDYRSEYLNGKAVVSANVGLDGQTQEIFSPGVLSPLGVTVRHANPYQGWSKPIEPWFGHTFPEWEKTLPGWCGSDNKQRPEKLEREIRNGSLLTLPEFTARLAERIDDYHQTEHSVLQATPISQWAGVKIEVPSARALDLLLMRHKPVKVYTQGIKLFGAAGRPRFYWHDDLALKVGHTVDVRYDPNDIGRLYVFDRGKFLCEAENQEALKMGASQEDLKHLHRRKQQAKKAVQGYRDAHRDLMNQEHVLETLVEARQQQQVVNLDVRPSAPGPDPHAGPQPGTVHKPARTPFDFTARRLQISRATTRSISPPPGSMATRPGRAGSPSTSGSTESCGSGSDAPVQPLTSRPSPTGPGLSPRRPSASMDQSDDVLSELLADDREAPSDPLRPDALPPEDADLTLEDLLDE
ncbi:Mu transposase C-terminal domain-containing protein [Candidatus Nitronereus thalassa]|uniref:Mu transposase C-terminal domain-containing protein n=1 Tax=Candidatus Nitronereus thalassa TaxID=3020898 RepID=A0ABU3K376_9BACT|nr:Mu transposase C-terminal domain-containing protein [Candidatus Nitronereus thalassa]MDT7040831.1 Mu transposase C-terminal domain-containing protein [Candidatus Nitronereus thalassa]